MNKTGYKTISKYSVFCGLFSVISTGQVNAAVVTNLLDTPIYLTANSSQINSSAMLDVNGDGITDLAATSYFTSWDNNYYGADNYYLEHYEETTMFLENVTTDNSISESRLQYGYNHGDVINPWALNNLSYGYAVGDKLSIRTEDCYSDYTGSYDCFVYSDTADMGWFVDGTRTFLGFQQYFGGNYDDAYMGWIDVELSGDTFVIHGWAYETAANTGITAGVVPVPASIWLFGTGLIGLLGLLKRKAG